MRYMILVSHAGLAFGVRSALDMLMGPRDHVLAFGMEEGTDPAAFGEKVAAGLPDFDESDEAVVLGDIAGGSPLKTVVATLEGLAIEGRFAAVGGLNLPMAIAALMAIEDDLSLDAVRDGILANGIDAVCQVA